MQISSCLSEGQQLGSAGPINADCSERHRKRLDAACENENPAVAFAHVGHACR